MSENVKPYEEGSPKKEQVRSMFDRIAFRYDFLNGLLSFGIDTGWRRKVVKMVRKSNPAAILDIATGTGDLAMMIAKKIPDTLITGLDLSPEMLNIAKEKIEKKGIKNITLCLGDAENLPFEADSFDAATAAFGVRNFENIGAGITDIGRVLKPGGKIYVLEFSMPDNKIFGTLYTFYFRRLLPFIGGLFSGERKAYRYLQQSVEMFDAGDKFAGLLREKGFGNVTQRKLTGGVAIIYTGTKN